jgi:cellulose synthase/poly-beta-1,6-N-acetylglucosamine synthase-like glycosyltransferase
MDWTQFVIAFSLALLAYAWIGYPAMLVFFQRLFPRPVARSGTHPNVSVILAVHNEEGCIEDKLRDCLNLDYPPDRIEFLVASDHSTDATETLAERCAESDPRIRLIRNGARGGKSGAQNLAAEHARGEILFFTDANTRMPHGALEQLIENFADPQVGLATATVHFVQPDGAVPQGQGLYWRYELMIREAESDLGILAKASGQALAVRRSLFRPMPLHYGDDCILPLKVRIQGYRVVHERRAVVTDAMPHTLEGEMRARIRMTARSWACTMSQLALLNPFRFPVTFWALVSHKVLRWLSPVFLAILFAASLVSSCQFRWVGLCLAQVAFYLSAFLGWQFVRKSKGAGVFGYAFAFCLANVGFLLGLIRALRSQRIVAY